MRYWKRLNPDGSTKTVGSYSSQVPVVNDIEITKKEYNSFIASLSPAPLPFIPKRDLAAEVDELKDRVVMLEDIVAKQQKEG